MFIIPFTHTSKTSTDKITTHTINILTQGGISVWQENDEIDVNNDALISNDLYAESIKYINTPHKICLCKIDTQKTHIGDFYKWDELESTDKESFCWRFFVIIRDNNGTDWLPVPEMEMLGDLNLKTLLNDILKDVRV